MDSKKILIVEDEFDILKLIEFNLKKEGFDVIAVSDGESAIKEVRSNKPDLILLDLMLPGISGLDVCHLIQKDEGLSQIPILMLTAKGEESDVVKGLEAGADDYVIKPFSVKVLLARIKALLRRDYGQEFDKKNKPEINIIDQKNIFGTLMLQSKSSSFKPKNEIDKNYWFTLDREDILKFTGKNFSKYIIYLNGNYENPRPRVITAKISNNHKKYAITWFSMAISILLIYLYFRKKNY